MSIIYLINFLKLTFTSSLIALQVDASCKLQVKLIAQTFSQQWNTIHLPFSLFFTFLTSWELKLRSLSFVCCLISWTFRKTSIAALMFKAQEPLSASGIET